MVPCRAPLGYRRGSWWMSGVLADRSRLAFMDICCCAACEAVIAGRDGRCTVRPLRL